MTRRLSTVIAGVAAALTLAGCGASTSSSAAGGAAPASGTANSSGAISIGMIGTFSGPLASGTLKMPEVMQAWASWTNAHGGIAGHQVKLYIEDDGGDATAAITDVRGLIQSDHVVALVSDLSYADSSWAAYAEQQGVPVIGGQSEDAPFVTNPDFFSSSTGAAGESYGLMAIAKTYGSKVATVYCAEAPVCKGAAAADAELGTGLGVHVAYAGLIAASAPDYTATCQAIKNSGAQSVVMGLASATVVKFVQDCLEQGVTAEPIIGGITGTSTTLASPAMKNFLDVDDVFPYFDSSTPATRAFRSAVKQYAPGLGSQLGSFAAHVWAAGELFAAAVQQSGASQVTAESVKAGLYALPKGTTLGGLTPPLSFTKSAATPDQVNCYFVWGNKDGKAYEPQGLKTSCAPASVVAEYNAKNY
jgi:branched-chain amino acid transport system substrate-binding protein